MDSRVIGVAERPWTIDGDMVRKQRWSLDPLAVGRFGPFGLA